VISVIFVPPAPVGAKHRQGASELGCAEARGGGDVLHRATVLGLSPAALNAKRKSAAA